MTRASLLAVTWKCSGARSVLAHKLKEIRADHVHAPWASMDAFVAQLAARLLNIPYTVQARAYDVHRNSSVVGFPAKLANAEFVITNSRFNEEIILRSHAWTSQWKKSGESTTALT